MKSTEIKKQNSTTLKSIIVKNYELKWNSVYTMEKIVKCFGTQYEQTQFEQRHSLRTRQIEYLCRRAEKKYGTSLCLTSKLDMYGNFKFRIAKIVIPKKLQKQQELVEIPIVNPVDDVISSIFECNKSYVMDDGFTFYLHDVYSAETLVKYFGNETSRTYFGQMHKIRQKHRVTINNAARVRYGMYFVKCNKKDEYRGSMYVLSRIGHPNEQLLLRKMNKNIYQYIIPIFLGKMLQMSKGDADAPTAHVTKHSLYAMCECANQNYLVYSLNIGTRKSLSKSLGIPHDIVMKYFVKLEALCLNATNGMLKYLESCGCLHFRNIYKGSVDNVDFSKSHRTGNKQIFVRMNMKETLTQDEVDAYHKLLARLDKELHIKNERERWFGGKTATYRKKLSEALQTDGLCKKRYKYIYQTTEIIITEIDLCRRILKHLYHIDDVKNFDFTLLYEGLNQFIYDSMMPGSLLSGEECVAITLLNETLIKHDAALLKSEYMELDKDKKYDIFVNSTYLGNLSGKQKSKDKKQTSDDIPDEHK